MHPPPGWEKEDKEANKWLDLVPTVDTGQGSGNNSASLSIGPNLSKESFSSNNVAPHLGGGNRSQVLPQHVAVCTGNS